MYDKKKALVTFLLGILCFMWLRCLRSDAIKTEPTYFISIEKLFDNKTDVDWEEEMLFRKKKIEEVCRKNPNLLSMSKNDYVLRWERSSHLTLCKNSKAGSTSFEYMLASLLNYSDEYENPHNKKYFNKPTDRELDDENTILFTVVRHPFTRLVSAYRDKMAKNFGKDLIPFIIKEYREKRNKTGNVEQWTYITSSIGINVREKPTFSEFASYVVDSIENCLSSKFKGRCIDAKSGHWWPYYARCNPCLYNFNITAKIETFERDYQYIKSKSLELVAKEIWLEKIGNLTSKEKSDTNNENDHFTHLIPYNKVSLILNDSRFVLLNNSYNYFHENKSNVSISTTDLTRKFWALLSDEFKQRLRNVFHYDFELFNYDPYQFG